MCWALGFSKKQVIGYSLLIRKTMYRIRGGKWRGSSGKALVKSGLSHDERQEACWGARKSHSYDESCLQASWVCPVMSHDTETWEEDCFKEGERAYPHEGSRVAGASERVGGRKGSGQNAWCGQKGTHSKDFMGDREEKEFRIHEERFWRQGVWENKTSLPSTGPSAKGTRIVLLPVLQNKKWKCLENILYIYRRPHLVLRGKTSMLVTFIVDHKEQGHTSRNLKNAFDTVESVINQTWNKSYFPFQAVYMN